MRTITSWAALLLAIGTASAAWAQDPPEKSAAVYLSGLLVNDARDVLRDTALPPDAAAAQAMVLLQFATHQDASDGRTWRMLAEAARVLKKTDVEKDALRKVIAADSGDLVAQVHYIELLARASQTVEEQSATYQKALQEDSLDRQIRSEVAVRLARLAESRGDTMQARDYLNQALQLNDVNVGALRDLVRLAAADVSPAGVAGYRRALVTLLLANPCQGDAWVRLAHVCQTTGAHDRAADFLEAGGEQLAIDGLPISSDFRLELALEYGLSGRRVQGYQLAEALAELPDAPLGALLVAELLAQNLAAAGTLPAVATRPASQPATQIAFQRPAEIRKLLTELAQQSDNASALADAAGTDLTIMSTPGPDTPAWVDAYAKLVAPEDATLARLRGWLSYRQGKLDDARATLEKIANQDPLARVGLARILLDQGKIPQAGQILQELWAANPTDLLGLQVVLAAQKGKIALADSPAARDTRTALARLTPAVVATFRQPLDVQLVDARFQRDVGTGTPTMAVGQPVMLQVRITNVSGRAVPVGPEGIVKSVVGLAAATRSVNGAAPTPLGLYAVEDLQRVYRLDPQQKLEATVRADQGKLADMFQQHPESSLDVNVTVVTAPRILGAQQYSVGLAGLVVFPGDFRRAGFPLDAKAQQDRLAQELTTLTGDKQLLRVTVADAVLAGQFDETFKNALARALQDLAGSSDARVRATLVRALPANVPPELEKAAAGLADDADPLVRLMWATRLGGHALADGSGAAKATAVLEKQAGVEKDAAVKQWLQAELEAIKTKK